MKSLKKKSLILTAIVCSMVLGISIVNAQTTPKVTVRTDKPRYLPGEKGTIHVTFYNDANDPVSVHNITVIFNYWQAYIDGKWVGNKTIELDVTVKEKGIEPLDPIDFTVPSDGRAAVDCPGEVKIGTSDGFKYGYFTVHIVETPSYMEQIVTLLTILVVLVIVCTIIIAATIFLSARRPKVAWREPEKQQ